MQIIQTCTQMVTHVHTIIMPVNFGVEQDTTDARTLLIQPRKMDSFLGHGNVELKDP